MESKCRDVRRARWFGNQSDGSMLADQHERSLIEGVPHSSDGAFAEYAFAAFARLRFYYPATAARIATKAKKQAGPPDE